MIIREMKSDTCLSSTHVHTGTFLIGILTFVLEIISILFEISSHTESNNTSSPPINTTELANDHVKTFEYAGYYADQIVVGSGITRHLFYYAIHFLGLVASILLIYGNRISLPKFYFPFLVMNAVEIVVAGVEIVLYLVAVIGIRSGAYPDIPAEPEQIRANVIVLMTAAIILEVFAIVISLYFMWVVWRGKEYLEEYQKNPFDNNAFTVTYTNHGADTQSNAAQPSVPATYRI